MEEKWTIKVSVTSCPHGIVDGLTSQDSTVIGGSVGARVFVGDAGMDVGVGVRGIISCVGVTVGGIGVSVGTAGREVEVLVGVRVRVGKGISVSVGVEVSVCVRVGDGVLDGDGDAVGLGV